MSRQRLTLKLSGGHRLLVHHVDLDEPVSEADFLEVAEAAWAKLKRKRAKRPAERKHTAMRGGDDG